MNLLQQLNQQLATVVTSVLPSLVQVHNGRRGHGAGTIWHAEGLILTNAHVIARHHRDSLYVTLATGERCPARLLASDEKRDLAALAIDIQDAPTIALGSAKQLRAGDWLLAMGHPWGVKGAVAAGNFIAAGPPPEFSWAGGDLLQLGIQLRPGHSGGPLVDSQGRLVGINMMISGPEVGLAIPVHTVKAFLRERLSTPGKRALPKRQAKPERRFV